MVKQPTSIKISSSVRPTQSHILAESTRMRRALLEARQTSYEVEAARGGTQVLLTPRVAWRAAVVAAAEAAGAGASRQRLPLLPLRYLEPLLPSGKRPLLLAHQYCRPGTATPLTNTLWQEETPESGFNATACREFLTSRYQKGIERLHDAAQPHTQQYQSQAKVWGNATLLSTSDDFGAKLSAALHAFRERASG